MQTAFLFMSLSVAFASIHPFIQPFHPPKSHVEISQNGVAGQALEKVAKASVATVTGAQDPDLLGLWRMDSTLVITDTGVTDSIHEWVEMYLSEDGSADFRTRTIDTRGHSVDTFGYYARGSWATANGWFFSEVTNSVSWSSVTQTATSDSVGGTDSSRYQFSNVEKSMLVIIFSGNDKLGFAKFGSAPNFKLPVLTPNPILPHPVARKNPSRSGASHSALLRYQNRAYRITGARATIPGRY